MGKPSKKRKNPLKMTQVDCEQVQPGWADAALTSLLRKDAVAAGVTFVDDTLALRDRDGLMFVAVGVKDPAVRDMQIGIWSLTSLLDPSTITSVNDVARRYTMFPEAPADAKTAMAASTEAQTIHRAYATRYQGRL